MILPDWRARSVDPFPFSMQTPGHLRAGPQLSGLTRRHPQGGRGAGGDIASSHGSSAMCAARGALRGRRAAAPPGEAKPAEGRRPRPAPPRR